MVTKATHDRTLEAPDRPAFGPGGMTPRKGRPRASLALVLSVMLLATALSAGPAGTEPAVGTSSTATSAIETNATPELLPENEVLRFPEDHPNFPGQIITGDEDPALALERPDGTTPYSRNGLNVYNSGIADPVLLEAVEYGVCPQRDPGHPDYDPEYECPGGKPTVIRWMVEIDRYVDTNLFGGNFCKLKMNDAVYQAAFEVLADNGVKVDVQLWTASWTGAMWLCGFKSSNGIFLTGTKGLPFYRSFARHIYDLLQNSYDEALADLVSFGAWNEPDFFNKPYYQNCMVVPRNMVKASSGKWSGGSDPDPSNPYSQWAALHAVFDGYLKNNQQVPIPEFNNSAAASTNWTREWVNSPERGSNQSSCSTSTSLFDADGVNHWVGDALRTSHVTYIDMHRYYPQSPSAKRLAEYAVELMRLYDEKADQIDPVDPQRVRLLIGEVGPSSNWNYWAVCKDQPVDADDAREVRKVYYFLSSYLGDRFEGITWHGGSADRVFNDYSIWDPAYDSTYDLSTCPHADLTVDGDASDQVTVEQGSTVNLEVLGSGTLSSGFQEIRWWLPDNDSYTIGPSTQAITFDQPGTYEVTVAAYDNTRVLANCGSSCPAWDFDRTTVQVVPG